jgi:site-specific DNA-methyltransferase (adenine-specific)
MIFNCLDWEKDSDTPKIHPTQKPVKLLQKLIGIFTDEGDVVIDPVAGSGSTLLAAIKSNRKAYGFEIKKDFYTQANELIKTALDVKKYGYPKSDLENDPESFFERLNQ